MTSEPSAGALPGGPFSAPHASVHDSNRKIAANSPEYRWIMLLLSAVIRRYRPSLVPLVNLTALLPKAMDRGGRIYISLLLSRLIFPAHTTGAFPPASAPGLRPA